jgi:putative spermidine/putrescine transport system permease protein/spermidine/putrescine transport system permease protein
MTATVETTVAPVATVELNEAGLRSDEQRERWMVLGLCGPSLFVVAVVMMVPVAWLFWLSFVGADGSLSWENYTRLWQSSSYARIFRITFEVAFVTTGICMLFGYPLAYMISQLPRRAANLAMIAVLLPFWTSLLVRTYAWLVLLQRKGLINEWMIDAGIIDTPLRLVHNFTGNIIGMSQIMLPFLVLPLYASMKVIDSDYLKAAANLGASPIAAFWRVFFPLSLPGLFAGVLLVFVISLGFFVTPVVLGGGRIIMVAMRIEKSISLYSNWGAASALAVVLLIMTLVCLAIAAKFLNLDKAMGGGER